MRNPLDVLRDEALKEEESRERFRRHFDEGRINLGSMRLLEHILQAPPDQIIVEAITSHLKNHVSKDEIVEACRLSKELVVFDDGNTVAIGLLKPDTVMPSPDLKSIERFVEEHTGEWVIIPNDGSSVEYFGDWDDEAIYTLPRLAGLEDACPGDPTGLIFEITQALNLESVDYDAGSESE